ncbi:MAG: hypothetical protein WBP85_05030 [Terracidiphilus sp.]
MKRNMFMLAVAALIASGPAFAQESQPAQTAQPAAQTQLNQPAPTINQRRDNQQDRIANGIDSGQLTAGETKNLESREDNVNREIRDDRAADNGHLTQRERQQVNRQQNHLSNSIYQDKHNANVAHYGNNEVGQRRENQQDRIANGVRNGTMNAGQAARVENREQGINQQIHADRQANGGKLTGQQKSQINREQNGASRQIYRDKHNGK